jgi:signal transduction histidine kinase
MSHELRTPLNIINGMLYLVQSTELTDEQRKYLADMQSASTSLLELIEELLDFSNIEQGKFTSMVVAFNLGDVLENLSGHMAAEIEGKSLQFRAEISEAIPRLFLGNPRALKKILRHLLKNAVKFTNTGEIILKVEEVADEEIEQGKAKLLFSVSDTGIGIPPDIFSDMFETFVQGDGSNTRQYSGVGLGLAICKRLVEIQSGEIWLESEPGKGSTFYFTFDVWHAVETR